MGTLGENLRNVRHLLAEERGISLVMAMGIMLALSITGSSVVAFSASNSRSAEYSADNMASLHLAEAGEAYARSVLWNASDPTDPNAVPSGTVSLEGGTAIYAGTYDSGTSTWTITGTSSTPNPAGGSPITRTVTSQVAVTSTGSIGNAPWAIWVGDDDCGGFGFKFNGKDLTVEGGLHSNGDFEVNGEDVVTTDTASTAGGSCIVDVSGTNLDFDGDTMPTIDPTYQAWPFAFVESDFTCDFSSNKFEFATDGQTIPSGVYCASELFTITGDNVDGEITVISPEIIVGGDMTDLTPHEYNVLFFATGDKDMVVNAMRYTFEGLLWHPNGRVKINGDNASSVDGVIAAAEVEINGDAFYINGTNLTLESPSTPSSFTLENVAGSYTVN